MHLYILTEAVNIDVSEITLENGYIPVISSRLGMKGAARDPDLSVEPAVWFKVLVIDAISIDCAQRNISWSSVSGVTLDFKGSDSGIEACGSYCSSDDGGPSEDASRLTRSISESPFDCGEFYVYDRDLDEVYDSVPSLVSDYRANALSKEEFHVRLMHLLHVYILPNIKLGCEDIDNVSNSLKQQDGLLQDMDRRICALSENLQKWRNDRKEQRKKFIDGISSLSSVKPHLYPKELIDVLVNDVVGDVSDAWDALDEVQKEVDRYKTLPLSAYDPKLMQERRSKRDELYHKYENVITVREKLREVQERVRETETSKVHFTKMLPKSFKSTSEAQMEHASLCKVYMWLTKGEADKVSEIQALTDKKLLMLSVKEAMRTTLNELLKGKETFGVETDTTGALNATNVLNSLATSTAWQTLAEQVARIIANTQHALSQVHFRFCADVNARCTRLIEESTWIKRSSSETTLCIRSSGQSTSSSGKSLSGSNLDVSATSKCPHHSSVDTPHCCADDWPSLHGGVGAAGGESCRDSAVSEASCYSVLSTDGSATVAGDLLVKSRDSVRGGVTKTKKKKGNSKKSLKPAKSTFHSYVDDGQNAGCYDTCDSNASSCQRDDVGISKKAIETLLELIRQHFSRICKELQQELKVTQPRHFRKVWLNYETHFYKETIDNLIQLYQLEYSSITKALCKSVRTLTVADLSLDDALLSHMLVDVGDGERPPPKDDSSTCTTELSELSVSEVHGDKPLLKLLRNKARASPVELAKSQSAKLPSEYSTNPDGLLSAAASEVANCEATSDSSICALRRRLSSLPQRPKTIRLSLNVQYPKSGVIVYERTVCPVRNSVLVEAAAAFAEPASGPSSPAELDPSSRRLDSSSSSLPDDELGLCNSKLAVMKPKYKKQFALAFRCIDVAVTTRCPSVKFQHLTKCLREVSHQISSFYQELYGRSVGACSDELIDALVILLCNIDSSVLSQLYCQIMMLADIIPPFFDGSPFSFTLVQFVGACQFVQERILLKRNRNSS